MEIKKECTEQMVLNEERRLYAARKRATEGGSQSLSLFLPVMLTNARLWSLSFCLLTGKPAYCVSHVLLTLT